MLLYFMGLDFIIYKVGMIALFCQEVLLPGMFDSIYY